MIDKKIEVEGWKEFKELFAKNEAIYKKYSAEVVSVFHLDNDVEAILELNEESEI